MAKILVATDDAALYEVLSGEIEGEGHEIVWATDGKDAYDEALAQQPALVFLDEGLTVFHGLETCRMLREDPDVPERLPLIILGTELINPARLEKVGATSQFPKAHQVHELRELLSAHLPAESMS